MKLIRRIPTHWLVAGTAWVSRIVAASVQLVTVPILLGYLGTGGYAVYAVVISLVGWFALAEFGFGPSLQNFISEARAQDGSARRVMQVAATLVPALLVGFTLLFAFFARPLQGFLLRSLAEEIPPQPLYLLFVIGVVFIVTGIGSIAYRVFYAQQRGYLTHIYQGVASLVSLIAVLVLRGFYQGEARLLWALLAFALPPALFALLAYVQVFGHYRLSLSLPPEATKKLLSRAYRFAGFAFLGTSTLLVDYVVMSQTLTGRDITLYNIISNVYRLMYFVYYSLLLAIWPLFAEALAAQRWADANKMLQRYALLGVVVVLGGTGVFLLTKDLVVRILAPDSGLALPSLTIALFGFYFLLRVWTDTYAMVLQSMNYLMVFWIYVPLQALISIGGQYLLSQWLGLNGITLGLSLSFLLTVVWALPLSYRRLYRQGLRNHKAQEEGYLEAKAGS